jgi:hypothetical protein
LPLLVGFWWAVIAVEVGVFLLEGALLRVWTPGAAFDRLGLIALCPTSRR